MSKKMLFKGAVLLLKNNWYRASLLVNKNIIEDIIFPNSPKDLEILKNVTVIDCDKLLIIPPFVDLHTHSRINWKIKDKDEIKDFINSLQKGGFLGSLCMANTNPPISQPQQISNTLKRLNVTELKIYQCATATRNMLGEQKNDISKISKYTNFFSDDGLPIENSIIMKDILLDIKKSNSQLFVHEQDPNIVASNYYGFFNEKREDLNFFSQEYESNYVKRDLLLNKKINARIHFQHICTPKSLNLIKKYRKNQPNITCEVTPHHLIIPNERIDYKNGAMKMNPPLIPSRWQKKIIKNINKGVVDVIATDHAPHLKKDKEIEYLKAKNGVINIETCFSSLYTFLVKTKKIKLVKIIELLSINPGKILLNLDLSLGKGKVANFLIYNLNKSFEVNDKFLGSKFSNSLFYKKKLYGKLIYMIVNGKIIYKNDKTK